LQEGKGVIGAFIGAGAAAALYLRLCGKPLWRYADTLIPAVFVGYALARLGCLAAGCCYGVPTDLPWGVQYAQGSEPFQADVEAGRVSASAAHSVKLHPVALYLGAAGVLLYFVTRIVRSTPRLALSVALVGYGVIRFPLQFLRGDATPVWGPLDADQLACIAMVVVGIFLWLGRRKRTRFTRETA
jgi:phosphatidylglycerol:prolipoprotein diacylglycerol transferase